MERTTKATKQAMGPVVALLLSMSMSSHAADDGSIERGNYLARVGDCAACHISENGKPYAGGRAITTPFGKIYASNITPDRDTGIGAWTEADLYRAMHTGINREGKHLYPAFPYPWFTQVTPADVHDIKSYLDTLKPVHAPNRPPDLPWPTSRRSLIGLWNKLYFYEGGFVADLSRSRAWNRGAYLVQGLGHCGGCHTDKNHLGAPKKDKPLQGGPIDNMFAPSLAGDLHSGLGAWSAADITEYLKTGSNTNTAAAGAMAEVVSASTHYLSDADLAAVATYLKELPIPPADAIGNVDASTMRRGAAVYADNCSGCHMSHGEGQPSVMPALRGSSAVQARQADTLVYVVLYGAAIPVTTPKPTGLKMPAFADTLDDAQIADVASYIRNAWGNRSSMTSTAQVAKMRKSIRESERSSPTQRDAASSAQR